MTRPFLDCWIFWLGSQNIVFRICTINRYLGANLGSHRIQYCLSCPHNCYTAQLHYIVDESYWPFILWASIEVLQSFYNPWLKIHPTLCGGEMEDTIFNCSCFVAWGERERGCMHSCGKWFGRNTTTMKLIGSYQDENIGISRKV